MSRFMAVHTLPMTEAQAIEQVKSLPPFPAGFAWKLTYCDFSGHKFFCEWEAPSKEALEQLFKARKMPFEAVHSVKRFDVAAKKLEP